MQSISLGVGLHLAKNLVSFHPINLKCAIKLQRLRRVLKITERQILIELSIFQFYWARVKISARLLQA